jgi:hypothetical protein
MKNKTFYLNNEINLKGKNKTPLPLLSCTTRSEEWDRAARGDGHEICKVKPHSFGLSQN